jgi:hypothetical protein
MDRQIFQIGERLNEQVALQLAADLALAEPTTDLEVDFSNAQHFEPFGMLVASSAINRLRRRAQVMGRQLIVNAGNADPEGIAGHMGFWKSIGTNLGREVSTATRNDSYLPITRIGVDELYHESGGSDPLAAGVIEQWSDRLAAILAQPRSTPLLEALSYAMRELIRNVLEHAQAEALWLAGMSWPKRNYVQVAILDEGMGVRRSLATNPNFRFATDMEALRAALRPGVSRNLGRATASPALIERAAEERTDFRPRLMDNAGYGLYMISTLCREAGQFLIASGSASLAFVGSGEIESATGLHGTALRLVLSPTEVQSAWDGLFEGIASRGPAARRPLLSPSTLKRLGLDSLTGVRGADEKPKDSE